MTMRRRLLVSTASISIAAVVILGVPLGIVWSHRVRSDATGKLEREADGIAAAIDDRLEAHRPLNTAALDRLIRPGHQVTITTRAGARLIYGTPQSGSQISVRSAASERSHVTASEPSAEVSDPVNEAWTLVALLSLGGVLAALGLALFQARRLGRPLERLARTASELGTGDFSARAGHAAIPEIDAVGRALDTSAKRIADLLAREREFSTNVSHQLRTRLTALRLRLEELAALQDTELGTEESLAALAEADQLERTVTELLAVARGETASTEAVDLAALARAHAAIWEPLFSRAGRSLTIHSMGSIYARASRGAIGQTIDILLDNALTHGRGAVLVSVSREGPRAVIRVRDEGRNIHLGREVDIFERGSSGNAGTGVGLHLARALVEGIGGRLRLEHAQPTTFRIDVSTFSSDAAVAEQAAPQSARA
jgi:signal transduction histidine kinase